YQLFDAISVHYYREDHGVNDVDVDLEVAHSLGIPTYLGELGADYTQGSRAAYFRQQLHDAQNTHGLFMVRPWDFGRPWAAHLGSNRGLAWKHPDIGDVLNALKDPNS